LYKPNRQKHYISLSYFIATRSHGTALKHAVVCAQIYLFFHSSYLYDFVLSISQSHSLLLRNFTSRF